MSYPYNDIRIEKFVYSSVHHLRGKPEPILILTHCYHDDKPCYGYREGSIGNEYEELFEKYKDKTMKFEATTPGYHGDAAYESDVTTVRGEGQIIKVRGGDCCGKKEMIIKVEEITIY